MKNNKSISVEFWNMIFFGLSYISIFWLIRKAFKNKNNNWWFNFIDIWVLSNFTLAIISVFLVRLINIDFLSSVLVFYGLLRVFEIIIYQVNVLLFDEYRAKIKGEKYEIRGYRRMIINLFTNFVEITFWFASSYAFYITSLSDKCMSISHLIFSSFSTITTFGISELKINDETGLFILWFQSIAGLIMTLISIARFIGLLPRVDSKDEFEQ